ncbi:SusC/RagA family TonB-linked outer membrane protein [uncultured Proteiniphilum sp.]|jgi:TonB-linked SusC/RagA family outer membrane protein|uniref:SusC/RagA family TonB-linked outer membrane protein n=1 Tax=uncultured Proteiniphilum sp. TaxID=497637 RepID=UPI002636B601|nr:SusC/RagA family TonB-linked outer membrane protein [uncultured Proteiniphilum sp.]
MKKTIFKNKNIALFSWLFIFMTISMNMGYAQNKENKKAGKANVIEISATVVNEQGEMIRNAEVIVGEGATTFYTNTSGEFHAKMRPGTKFIIEARGYETKILDATEELKGSRIVLSNVPLFSGEKDMITLPGNVITDKRYNTGAVSKISASELESYPAMGVGNMLQGKLMGLISNMNTGGGIGTLTHSLNIRGLHRGGGDGFVTIIDGVERTLNVITAEELESIEVLKDATTKILYGPRAANGVLLVTTKKGDKHKRIRRVTGEYGIGIAADHPQFLNSHDYSALYNEARINDGLAPIYSAQDLTGYKNSTGPNDFRYPNLDYYDYFLNKNNNYRKAILELSGGNEGVQYSLIGGYEGMSGLEKIGDTPQRNRFNARGNLGVRVNDYISATMGIAAVFDVNSMSSLSQTQVMQAVSSHRPNEYPIFIPESVVAPDSVGYPNFGASNSVTDNLYGSLQHGGYRKGQTIDGQLNFGLNYDFNKLLKGLTGSTHLTFDNRFSGTESLSTTAATYSQRWVKTATGEDSVIMIMRKKADKNDDIKLSNSTNFRTTSFIGLLTYNRSLNKENRLKADWIYNYYLNEATGLSQDTKFMNSVLKINYINSDKYIADFSVGGMGSNKFRGNNKYAVSYALGLGWILSEEDIIRSINGIDYLKFKASAGVLPYDGQTQHDLHNTQWNNNGAARLNNSLNPSRTNIQRIGNPDLKWEKSRELNVGIEFLGLNKRLWFEANYFNEYRYNIIQQVSSIYSDIYGSFYSFKNWGEVLNRGIEAELSYSDRIDRFFYQAGFNMIYVKNKQMKIDRVQYPDEYLNWVGDPSDAMYGYVSRGLFGKDIDMSTAPVQYFGPYQAGDIAYEDLNGDNRIDELDIRMVGNSFPRIHLGINLNLNYKGFGLYVLGTGQFGYYNWKNSSYYWFSGEDKYSVEALNRYHATSNPEGDFPRLTATSSSNNYRNSTFWIEKADLFRIKNVEVSYTLENKTNASLFYRALKLFVRGTNLACITQVKDRDPEAINAGLDSYPLMKTVTAGLTVSF